VRHNSVAPELAVILDPLEMKPERQGVLRYLGYPTAAKAAARIEARLDRALDECRGKPHPRAMYALYPVEQLTPRRLTLRGGATITGRVGEFLSGARRVAVFVVTAGEEIAGMAEAATRARDTLSGLVYDAIGSHLADAAVERLAGDLRGRLEAGETLTLPYSPGYCGIPLAGQRALFRLIEARRIGVELLPALIMKPVKSVSGLFGLGPREQVTAFGHPCDRCPLANCHMRRETMEDELR